MIGWNQMFHYNPRVGDDDDDVMKEWVFKPALENSAAVFSKDLVMRNYVRTVKIKPLD